MGRFVNEDPSGFDGGDVNLYRYCNNSPVINVDPSGLCWSGIGQGVSFDMSSLYSQTATARKSSSYLPSNPYASSANSTPSGGYTTGVPNYVPTQINVSDWSKSVPLTPTFDFNLNDAIAAASYSRSSESSYSSYSNPFANLIQSQSQALNSAFLIPAKVTPSPLPAFSCLPFASKSR